TTPTSSRPTSEAGRPPGTCSPPISVGVDLRPEAGQPEMATVNAILDALPAAAREAVLVRFLSAVYAT
ncbi:aspartate aminotransferase family protein, partial [Nonomuraea angiospora]